MSQDNDVARLAAALKAPGLKYRNFNNEAYREPTPSEPVQGADEFALLDAALAGIEDLSPVAPVAGPDPSSPLPGGADPLPQVAPAFVAQPSAAQPSVAWPVALPQAQAVPVPVPAPMPPAPPPSHVPPASAWTRPPQAWPFPPAATAPAAFAPPAMPEPRPSPPPVPTGLLPEPPPGLLAEAPPVARQMIGAPIWPPAAPAFASHPATPPAPSPPFPPPQEPAPEAPRPVPAGRVTLLETLLVGAGGEPPAAYPLLDALGAAMSGGGIGGQLWPAARVEAALPDILQRVAASVRTRSAA